MIFQKYNLSFIFEKAALTWLIKLFAAGDDGFVLSSGKHKIYPVKSCKSCQIMFFNSKLKTQN
jgi:hypothetical protein